MVQGKLLGTTIGRIRLIDFVGTGGVGEVYLGFDETLERLVAVKAIRSELRLQPETRARFFREARMLSQLEHPNICRIYDLIEGEDNDCLVLELIDGDSLRDKIAEGIDDAFKMRIIQQIVQALKAVHGHGVIHRDLKPENVMITTSGEVKVLDFGLARGNHEEVAARDGETSTIRPRLGSAATPAPEIEGSTDAETEHGRVVGTIGYMSPEQAAGEPATAASDMYSLGLLMQEILTGKPPFDSELDHHEKLRRAARGETRPVTGLAPELTRLIERLKSLAPGARPSSVDVAERLRWIHGERRRKRWRRLLAAAWLVALALCGAMAIQTGRQKRLAARQVEAAQQLSRFMIDIFQLPDGVNLSSDLSAQELLDRATERIRHDRQAHPLAQARLMDAVGNAYLQLGLTEQAMPLITDAYQLRLEHHGADHAEVAESLTSLGLVAAGKGRRSEAEEHLRQALQIWDTLGMSETPSASRTVDALAGLGTETPDSELTTSSE
jgi:serine/threonine protein kinase